MNKVLGDFLLDAASSFVQSAAFGIANKRSPNTQPSLGGIAGDTLYKCTLGKYIKPFTPPIPSTVFNQYHAIQRGLDSQTVNTIAAGGLPQLPKLMQLSFSPADLLAVEELRRKQAANGGGGSTP
jgi:hypothetical protein